MPSVVMYPVSFQLFVSPKNSFADFTWPFFSASTGAFSENCGLTFSPSAGILVLEAPDCVAAFCRLSAFLLRSSARPVFSFIATMSYRYFLPSEALRITNSASYAL